MSTTTRNMHQTFESIRIAVCDKLRNLSPHLTYHNIGHTLDVLQQSECIALKEGMENDDHLFLLKVAALYHDTGFLVTYANHEEASCRIFLDDAPAYGFSDKEKDFITRLIMATKLPQQPADIYECIICDADLDYLGRPDFFTIGDGLRREFLHYGIVASNEEWEKLQIRFLTNHHYHTNTLKREREAGKKQHLAMLQ